MCLSVGEHRLCAIDSTSCISEINLLKQFARSVSARSGSFKFLFSVCEGFDEKNKSNRKLQHTMSITNLFCTVTVADV